MVERAFDWAVGYAGGAGELLRHAGVMMAAPGGVAVVCEDAVLLGCLKENGRVFYVHLAVGEMQRLLELGMLCLGERADGVERVMFERGSRDDDRGMRCVGVEKLLKIKY